MEFNVFIVPATLVGVELIKKIPKVGNTYLPVISIALGTVLGVAFAAAYSLDLFSNGFQGAIAGAAACGLYDVAKPKLQN